MPNATAAAEAHWVRVKSNMPQELPGVKDLVAIEVINEPDQDKCGWLSNFSLAISKLAVAEGWTIFNYGWSTGTPHVGASGPSCWTQPETKAFLSYAAASNGKVGIALHEYSLTLNITNQWPWLLGRYHFLLDAMAAQGLPKGSIPISITEWGWTECDVKLPPTEGVSDVDLVMHRMGEYSYDQHPEVRSAMMWYLGPWHCPISNNADQLVLPIANYSTSSK